MTVGAARPYHHGNLRAELLARAERTLAEQGAGNLSLRELARQTGVSHAAPRRHFADKQALLDALAEDGFERLGAELRDALAGADEAFAARLLAFARTYVHFATEHAALLELMFAGKHRNGAERLGDAARAAFAAPLALIEEGQAAGELLPGNPERVATVVLASCHGLAALANNGMLDAETLDDVVPEVVDRLLSGVRPR
jgi:AcrR family transcriptional regulator